MFACTKVRSYIHTHMQTLPTHTCLLKAALNALNAEQWLSVLCWSGLNATYVEASQILDDKILFAPSPHTLTYPFLSTCLLPPTSFLLIPAAYFIFSHWSPSQQVFRSENISKHASVHTIIAFQVWTYSIELTTTEYMWPNLWPSTQSLWMDRESWRVSLKSVGIWEKSSYLSTCL